MRTMVASGKYVGESEMIRDGLRALQTRDRAVERWLREAVAPAYDALKTSPKRAVGGRAVRAALAKTHKRAKRSR